VADVTPRLQKTGAAIAAIDSLASLAEIADRHHYVKPKVDEGDEVIIHDGRHPVLERMDLPERFVPNDTLLNTRDHQILMITGPNMAGKSTYLRQVALIISDGSDGEFCACQKRPGWVFVDRIFTRIGASDNIMRGRARSWWR